MKDMSGTNQHAGLLNLATSMTGRPVDMDLVQIRDAAVFGEMAELMMKASAIAVAEGVNRLPDIGGDTGYAQDDGRLLVPFVLPGGIERIMEVPPGGWREMNTVERSALDEKFADAQTEAERIGMDDDQAICRSK